MFFLTASNFERSREFYRRLLPFLGMKPWVPGYYFLLFEDPDGIRLKLNHVPRTGLLT